MLSVVINLNEYIMREKLRGVEFGLIVVDSIGYPFRANFSQRASKRVNQLLNIANYLNKIATAHNIAVGLAFSEGEQNHTRHSLYPPRTQSSLSHPTSRDPTNLPLGGFNKSHHHPFRSTKSWRRKA
eukprot:GHVN01051930.1.p1 GENE.GHVN01051930.1~~GHVN01051930.1.p1  ORF type:complete len:147 (+),score=27.31 GHVN01051930.1:61-441(+)